MCQLNRGNQASEKRERNEAEELLAKCTGGLSPLKRSGFVEAGAQGAARYLLKAVGVSNGYQRSCSAPDILNWGGNPAI